MIDLSSWGWPQMVQACLVLLALGVSLADHGKPKTGRTNFFVTLFAVAVSTTILVFGGFYA
jgi:hypothetical protein